MSFVLLLASLAFAGDAPEADPSWSNIVNGKAEKGFPSAVAIGFDAQGFGRQSTCSASLITPRLLLTAGHCTAEYEKQGLQEELILQFGATFFGATVEDANKVVGFEDLRVHPKYSGSDTQIRNDIQVIVLDEEVTDRPATWFETDAIDGGGIGETVTSVGYGITSSSAQNSSGIKRSAELVVADADDQFLYSRASGNPNGANVCSGDSGGPQYHIAKNGRITQWAVHSFVFSTSGGDPCLQASGSTRVDTFADWILKSVDDVHGTTDHCEINGLYGDSTCDKDCAETDVDCDADINGDGVVDADEFVSFDGDGDGELTDKDVKLASRGCNSAGGAGSTFAAVALAGLLLRRRRA